MDFYFLYDHPFKTLKEKHLEKEFWDYVEQRLDELLHTAQDDSEETSSRLYEQAIEDAKKEIERREEYRADSAYYSRYE